MMKNSKKKIRHQYLNISIIEPIMVITSNELKKSPGMSAEETFTARNIRIPVCTRIYVCVCVHGACICSYGVIVSACVYTHVSMCIGIETLSLFLCTQFVLPQHCIVL